MESRLLYNVTNFLQKNLEWQKVNDEEWIYFGSGKDVNMEIAQKWINEHFKGYDIYLVQNRVNSGSLDETLINNMFKQMLGNDDFFLWNKDLTKAIEFKSVGVLRLGEIRQSKL